MKLASLFLLSLAKLFLIRWRKASGVVAGIVAAFEIESWCHAWESIQKTGTWKLWWLKILWHGSSF